MDSTDRQVLAALTRWSSSGHRVALITVARTWGSAPRPAGAWMALRDDGVVAGSVSGGCIEDDLISRMRAGEFAGDRPLTLVYGVSRAQAARFGLPCGGTLELVIEPRPDLSLLAQIEQSVAAGRLVARTLEVASGRCSVDEATPDEDTRWDGKLLRTVHGPARRLLIIGAGEISRHLAEIAQALDYSVSVCDPRQEYRDQWDLPRAPLVEGMPDDVVVAMQPDPHTAIVALTHDPKLDDLALLEALNSPAFYVGALGSRRNDAARRERLRQHFDLDAAALGRLHGPVGLPIGSRTAAEIAVSIIAEMVAVRHGIVLRSSADQRAEASPMAGGDAMLYPGE
ncbi:XdhC family protein [Accumulibacter sp.]|uniref:XdhC family protein n=1 Tax=Accumulibacter sp. TaxID=2053492 RepID=UPI0025CC510E|nr:XdhC family protein [Accumulibacter sp.]MCM8627574.1 XdhC family protein [Accumulibacter sp.]